MIEYTTSFANRQAAGRALAQAVASQEPDNPTVLALPRGGVPVAFEVAKVLTAPLDLVMVQKLGAPGHPEYAIGAIVDGENPEVVIDQQAAAVSGASERYLEREMAAALSEIRRRRSAYGVDQPLELAGRTAILVDDGIATGSTVKVALKAIRKANPRRIVLAVPVAPPEALSDLAPLCDDVICLKQPRPFHAVGAHYDDFEQTSDSDVVSQLEQARSFCDEAGN